MKMLKLIPTRFFSGELSVMLGMKKDGRRAPSSMSRLRTQLPIDADHHLRNGHLEAGLGEVLGRVRHRRPVLPVLDAHERITGARDDPGVQLRLGLGFDAAAASRTGVGEEHVALDCGALFDDAVNMVETNAVAVVRRYFDNVVPDDLRARADLLRL